MLSWLLLVSTLAVPLATSRTDAQSTTTSSSAPNITDTTTNTTTAVTAPTTFHFTTSTTTTTVPFTTATTAVPFTTTITDQTKTTGHSTTTHYPETTTTTTVTTDQESTTLITDGPTVATPPPPSLSTPSTLPPSTTTPSTLPPSNTTPSTLPPSNTTPSTLPPTTMTPSTLPPSNTTPSTLPPSTTTPSTLPPSNTTPSTLPPTTMTPSTLPPSNTTPSTLPPPTTAPSTLPPSNTTPSTLPPSNTTPSTLPPSNTTPSTLPPPTTTPSTLPPPTTTPSTLPPSTMTPSILPPSTMTPSTLPPSNTTPSTLPPTTMTPSTLPPPTTTPSTLPPSTMTPSTLPPSNTTPSTLPPTTMTPSTLPPPTTTPYTLPPTTMTPSTLPPSNTTPYTLPPTTMTPSTLPPSNTTPYTLPPTTMTPSTLPPSNTTPYTLPPTTMTPSTLPPSNTTPYTLPPTTMTPSTLPPSNTTPSTLPPPTTTPYTLPPTTMTPSTLPPSNTTPSTLPPSTMTPSALPPTMTPSTLPPSNTTPSTLPPSTMTPSALPPTMTPSTLPPSNTTPYTLPPTTTTPSTLPPTTTTPSTLPPSNTTLSTPPTTTVTPSTPPSSTTRPSSTASSTTTTPPTTTPLVCENGGIPLHGVCICPDEWTGETCSDKNFCPEQQLGEFSFPRTPIGWFAYSEEICPQGTSGAGKPRATTRCVLNNGSPSFERVQEFKCDQTLSDIQQNLTSPADLESLATSTQILTSNPEELTAENITAAAQIANTLLLSPNATESVRVAAVATVSQLLNTSTPDDDTGNNATLGLTVTLDELSVSLSLTLNTSESQLVQPNLVVQSAQVPAADTQGVQFTSLSGTSGSFVADRIKLNTNTPSVVVDDGGIPDALIYVRFPPEAVSDRQKPSNVSLGFVLYQNDRFFRSRRYKSQRATIRVLSGSVSGQERSVVPQHVEMMFRPTTVSGTSLYDFACVFWNYTLEEWSTDGCSKGNASDGFLRCFCNHTTNFAALWSFREKYEYAEALDWISIVGLSVSILGLVVTIIHHIKENFCRSFGDRQNNKNSKIAQLCIYISLLAFIITFISGVGNSSRQNDAPVKFDTQPNSIPVSEERVEPDRGSCTAVAALLHFFLLATFMWNSVYGTQLVLVFRSMRRGLPRHWTKLSLTVGWGVPAVIMAITLGATYRVENPLEYRQEEFCWLAALDKTKQFNFKKPMFWSFLLPVSLILIYNIVLLVLASVTTCRTNPNLKSTSQLSLMKKFLISFSLAVLLGLSWTLGYLVLVTSGHTHLVFSIIFCVCTTTQGFQIFILFTARTPSFRSAVSRTVSSVTIQLNNRTYNLWKKSAGTTSSDCYRDRTDRPETMTLSQF